MSTRRRIHNTLLFYLLLLCVSTNVDSIPFSTVFRRTQTLLRKSQTRSDALREHSEQSKVAPEKKSSSRSVTSTVYSLLGGFADARWTRRRSSLSSTIKEDTTRDHSVPPPPSTTSQETSAHLKLGSAAMMPSLVNDKDNELKQTKEPSSQLHTYYDPIHNISLSGLNVSKRKFTVWVQHTLEHKNDFNASLITTRHVAVDDSSVRQELRDLWKQRRLLTDRTEVLAVYKSEQNHSVTTKKRGGFPDLLHIYAERLSAMIEDEDEEFHIAFGGKRKFNRTGVEETKVPRPVLEILDGGLLGWLEREYGVDETKRLCHNNMQDMETKEQYAVRECGTID